jgi:hypothetical protein
MLTMFGSALRVLPRVRIVSLTASYSGHPVPVPWAPTNSVEETDMSDPVRTLTGEGQPSSPVPISRSEASEHTPAPPDGPSSGLLSAMPGLVPAAEPAIVLASLATVCVPAVADQCVITVIDGPTRYEIRQPARAGEPDRPQTSRARHAGELSLPFQQEACGTHPAFTGHVSLRWTDHRPGPADAIIAKLLVDRATDAIHRERLKAALATETARADNLEIALASNREIGQALGILTATRKITDDQAFDLLRRISQHTNRKLRDIAADVCLAGRLDIPPNPATD